RRAFIRKSALAAAALAVPLVRCGSRQPEIAIVGGGLAGLSAGYTLRKSGIPFTLYEASGRLGGRTFTIPDAVVDGAWVDFGAEYVDTTHVHLIDLATELGVPITDLRSDPLASKTFYFEGRYITEKEIVEALNPYVSSIQQDIDSLPDELHYRNANAFRELDNRSITDYLKEKGINGWLYRFLDMALVAEYAMDCEEQSALNLLVLLSTPIRYDEHYHLFGAEHEVMKVKGGTGSLSDALGKNLGDSVRTGWTLKGIDQQQDRHQLIFETSEGEQKLMPDLIILALPLPVLRQISRNFRFPDRKERSIAETGFGNAAKVAMGFTSRPWREQGFQGYTFTDVNETVIWDSSQGVDIPGGSLSFIGGGKISDDFLNQSYADITDKWLSGAEQIYPGVKAAYNGRISKFCWAVNPLAGGSYTCYRKGQWSEFFGVDVEPVGNILFAGEHCSLAFQGYMNGAIETGLQAAKAVISRLKV
ncbi:MAG: flavin monoamine oxidase family protein, partial [Bacteroidota bacterium]